MRQPTPDDVNPDPLRRMGLGRVADRVAGATVRAKAGGVVRQLGLVEKHPTAVAVPLDQVGCLMLDREAVPAASTGRGSPQERMVRNVLQCGS